MANDFDEIIPIEPPLGLRYREQEERETRRAETNSDSKKAGYGTAIKGRNPIAKEPVEQEEAPQNNPLEEFAKRLEAAEQNLEEQAAEFERERTWLQISTDSDPPPRILGEPPRDERLPDRAEEGGNSDILFPWTISRGGDGVKVSPGYILGKFMTFTPTATITPDGPDSCVILPIGYHENEDFSIAVPETGYICVDVARSTTPTLYSSCESQSETTVYIEDYDQVSGTLLGEEVVPYFSATLPNDETQALVHVLVGKVTIEEGEITRIDRFITHNPEVFIPVTRVDADDPL